MRRIIMALVAGGVLAGAVYGAAASLGNITGQDIAASDASVVSCNTAQTPLPVTYQTALDGATFPALQRISDVSITFPATCMGQSIRLRLTSDPDGAGGVDPAILYDASMPVAAGPTVWTIPIAMRPPVSAVNDFHLTQQSGAP